MRDFSHQELGGANFRGQDLQSSSFKCASLQRADFYRANLHRASFHNADLREANLNEADLRNCDFSAARLEMTCLDPMGIPNGEVRGFERAGEFIIGYRTQNSPVCGGEPYEVGRWYVAPVFSISQTACHPGIYLCPKEWMVWEQYPLCAMVLLVRARASAVHCAGGKWRAKVIEVVNTILPPVSPGPGWGQPD